MFCPKCGSNMEDQTRCSNCGYLSANSTNQYTSYGNNQNSEDCPKFTFYLVWGIVQFVCCCWITGGLMIGFDIAANSAYKLGDIRKYESNIKVAKVSMIIGFIIGPLLIVLSTLLGLSSAVAEILASGL